MWNLLLLLSALEGFTLRNRVSLLWALASKNLPKVRAKGARHLLWCLLVPNMVILVPTLKRVKTKAKFLKQTEMPRKLTILLQLTPPQKKPDLRRGSWIMNGKATPSWPRCLKSWVLFGLVKSSLEIWLSQQMIALCRKSGRFGRHTNFLTTWQSLWLPLPIQSAPTFQSGGLWIAKKFCPLGTRSTFPKSVNLMARSPNLLRSFNWWVPRVLMCHPPIFGASAL